MLVLIVYATLAIYMAGTSCLRHGQSAALAIADEDDRCCPPIAAAFTRPISCAR